MGLRLEIVSHQRQGLGRIGFKEFGHDGGTIGRSLSNDWALPDTQRFMSARHARIDYRSGSYYIVDTSTNGVFVNESEAPVGRGKPQRLFDGDRIRIGDYLMQAKIDTDTVDDAITLLDFEGHIDPVEQAQRVDSADEVTQDLLDEHEMTSVGMELDAEIMRLSEESDDDGTRELRLVGDTLQQANEARMALQQPQPPRPAPQPAVEGAGETAPQPVLRPAAAQARAAPQPTPQPAPKPATKPQAPPKPQATPKPQAAPRQAQAAAQQPAEAAAADGTTRIPKAALAAFFRGAGLEARRLDERQAAVMLFLVGQLLRELLTGLSESLHVRSQQKNAMRISSTTIQKVSNNPLKFSAGTDEALDKLLFQESGEYLGAVEAVRDAFGDVNAHQNALLAALGEAVPAFLTRFDPNALESKFAGSAGRGLLSGSGKSKYWDLYKNLYATLSERREGAPPTQFLDDLAAAYESRNRTMEDKQNQPAE